MLAYEHHLVVFPINPMLPAVSVPKLLPPVVQKLEEHESDLLTILSHSQISQPYVIDLEALGIRKIKDMTFLVSYLDPSLVILHEPEPTFAGRYAISKDSVQLGIVSLSSSGTPHVISRGERLPHDCSTIVMVPEPIGGALVIGNNLIVHFQQGFSAGVSLNEFGAMESLPLVNSPVVCSLLAPVATFLTTHDVLISSKSRLFIVNLKTHADGYIFVSLLFLVLVPP